MSRRILDLNARPVDHRNDPRLNAILKRADTGILILAAIERGDSLTDALNDGVFFPAMCMQNVIVEFCSTGLKVHVFRIDLHDLLVRSRDIERFTVTCTH
jgi:hypothetical protein